MFRPNLRSIASPVPEIIAIRVLGGLRTPNLGVEEFVEGRGWYRSKERWWVPTGRSNFSSTFTRFTDIAAFVLQHTTLPPLYPTPPLVSSQFLHVSLEVSSLWARRAKVLVYLSLQLVFEISNLCDHNPPTSRTDRQTVGQTTCNRITALCTTVHRAVKLINSVLFSMDVAQLDHAVIVQFSGVARSRYLNMC